jgi:hyperosmotically inducible protein
MRTSQLFCLVALLVTSAACSRQGIQDDEGRHASDRFKASAARARDRLADSWLTTKVQAQYFADEDIKLRHLNVSTRDGVVTLTGFVETAPEHEQAVQLAKFTDGVRAVTDRLVVKAPEDEGRPVATSGTAPSVPAHASGGIDDAAVTARVQSRYFLDDRIKARRIAVDTRGGVVTLSGEVASEDERAQALLLARTTDGVQRVEDTLMVRPEPASASPFASTAPPDDAALTATIQARYFVDDTVKRNTIDVSVKDGVVLLQGAVDGDAAHQQAIALARSTGGVVQVVDRLMVARQGR